MTAKLLSHHPECDAGLTEIARVISSIPWLSERRLPEAKA